MPERLTTALPMARLPLAAPATVGVKFTGTLTLALGAIVIGTEGAPDPSAKPAPLTVRLDTVQFAVPLLPMVVVIVLLLPTFTDPKASAVGLTVMVQTGVGVDACTVIVKTSASVSAPSLTVMVTFW